MSTYADVTSMKLIDDGISDDARRAFICCLCHKFHALHETDIFITPPHPATVDVAAEMLGELTGLTVQELYSILECCEGNGDEIFRELESRLPLGHQRNEDGQPREVVRRALLRSLCHALQRLFEGHIGRLVDLRRTEAADLVVDLVGKLVGLQYEEIYEIYDRCEGMGNKLSLELEPRLAAGYGNWMLP